jgi:CRISPR-associated endonuclease Csy4
MDYYIDLSILRDPEFPPDFLRNALMAKLHRALSGKARNDIGLSFPGYRVDLAKPTLGDVLRLHGNREALEALQASDWLRGMHDHINATSLAKAPTAEKFRRVSRVQAKSSPERLRRRRMKRAGISYDEAVQAIPDSAAETLRLPYFELRSTSTGQAFRLFVRQESNLREPVEGTFSPYGLSATATVPAF